jgi:NAD(P)-dependent dehydrogenase (short-subunit alcohol dehydrogenase family)
MINRRLLGRVALVTGASQGIGRATALALAFDGAHVIAVARTLSGLEELGETIRSKGGACTCFQLDLSDLESIDILATKIQTSWNKLDILVANAATLGPIAPLSTIEPSAWDKVLCLNVTAQWRLLRALDPLLRNSVCGRVVMLTSGAAWTIHANWGPYAVSKAALNAIALTYAEETKHTPIRVTLFSPGAIRTAMRAQAVPHEDPKNLALPEGPAAEIVELCLDSVVKTGAVYDYPRRTLKWLQPPV